MIVREIIDFKYIKKAFPHKWISSSMKTAANIKKGYPNNYLTISWNQAIWLTQKTKKVSLEPEANSAKHWIHYSKIIDPQKWSAAEKRKRKKYIPTWKAASWLKVALKVYVSIKSSRYLRSSRNRQNIVCQGDSIESKKLTQWYSSSHLHKRSQHKKTNRNIQSHLLSSLRKVRKHRSPQSNVQTKYFSVKIDELFERGV